MVFHFKAGKIILVNWKECHVLFWISLIIPLYNQNHSLDCQSSMELLLSCPPPLKVLQDSNILWPYVPCLQISPNTFWKISLLAKDPECYCKEKPQNLTSFATHYSNFSQYSI